MQEDKGRLAFARRPLRAPRHERPAGPLDDLGRRRLGHEPRAPAGEGDELPVGHPDPGRADKGQDAFIVDSHDLLTVAAVVELEADNSHQLGLVGDPTPVPLGLRTDRPGGRNRR